MAASLVLTKDVVAQRKVTPDAPLDARLRALDGVLVAVPSATSAPLGAIRAAVESVGARMRLTYMAQGAMMAAMERGAIEGMIAAFPFVGMPVLRGVGVTWIDGPAGDLPAEMRITSSATVQTTGAYLRSNRAIIGRFQRAIVAIAGYVTQEQAGARAALAALYPQMSEREIELAFAGQWRNLTKPFLTEADMRQELRLLIASTKAAGLEALDPAQALVGPI
jgi:ABC-type nitrate/sulfonate/bicarbonate transport system substrate-binding protein